MTRKQAFGVLDLAEGASPEEIKRAYRRLAFALHPDLHPDNPNASKDFQRLNEAYVLLSPPPSASSKSGASHAHARAAAASEREATEKARTDARRAYERAKGRFEKDQTRTAASSGSRQGATHKARPQAAPAGEDRTPDRDEVLRDLLRDPFARRVFEDIYSQIRNDARRAGKAAPRPRPASAQPGLVGSVVGSMVEGAQGWLRRQIDEEQTVQFAGALVPGSRVRLQVSHGLMSKPRTIELTLPPEFEIGRPIRLKGMGKRIGKWSGDLYLKILSK